MGNTASEPEPFLEVHTVPEEAEGVKFSFSTPLSDFEEFVVSKLQSKKPLRVTLLTHGYLSHIKREGEHFYDIKDAILGQGHDDSHVVLLVDWSALSGSALMDYRSAVTNVQEVAKWLGRIVATLRRTFGAQGVFIHGIGFSLGAHLMGNTAEEADSQLGDLKAFDRITGLDPAGPIVVSKGGASLLFGLGDTATRTTMLNKDHATFVDVIHTTDHLGTPEPLGHVDFYPNWGSTQKGLPNLGYLNFLSHIYCLKLFLHTIQDREKFVTGARIEKEDLLAKKVSTEESQEEVIKPVTMGYFCEPDACGMYYVQLPPEDQINNKDIPKEDQHNYWNYLKGFVLKPRAVNNK